MLRRRRPPPDPCAQVDPAALDLPWRDAVARALAARARFRTLAERTAPGPLRTRLEEMAAQLDAGVLAAWDIARRAQAAAGMLADVDPAPVGDRLKAARRRLAEAEGRGDEAATAALREEVDLLAGQFGSLNRLRNGVDGVAERLGQIELRLEAAVAQAAELVLSPAADATAVGDDLERVVADLAALQGALADL